MTLLKALVFDMDGTIVDSDPTHLRAFADAFAPYGVHVDEEVFRTKISGRTNPLIFGTLLPGVPAEEYARLADEKEAHYRKLAHDLTPLHGLPEVLGWAQMRSAPRSRHQRSASQRRAHALGARDGRAVPSDDRG